LTKPARPPRLDIHIQHVHVARANRGRLPRRTYAAPVRTCAGHDAQGARTPGSDAGLPDLDESDGDGERQDASVESHGSTRRVPVAVT
jgi:hypothetical protein